MPYNDEEWDAIEPFVDDVFVRVDRPNEQLLHATALINGDGSYEIDFAWSKGLTDQDRRDLVQVLINELRNGGRSPNRGP